jgi:membrane fusion protein (multidrug efflux system)
MQTRMKIAISVAAVVAIAAAAWLWLTAGHESTDDAQVEAHVTQIAARVGGQVIRVAVKDNQPVAKGDVLVEVDPRDYLVAVDKARAELAQAEADLAAARVNVPITSTQTTSTATNARGGVEQAQGAIAAGEREVEAARARLTSAQARQREAEANAAKSAKDVDRLRGLLAKDEIAQQQFDATAATADAQRAAVDSARSQVTEAQAGIHVAESRLMQARAGEQQARAELAATTSGPQQVAAVKARAQAADAGVAQAKAQLAQAELNLDHATVKAAVAGIVTKKQVEVGQSIQAGQPLMSVISLDDVWVIANFKETQLAAMHPGQRASIDVDAYGQKFNGHVESIAAATGSRFSMLPPENATGNFVKVVQRVPVKIVLEPGQDPDHKLRPGLSVTPTVYTK